MSRPTSLRDVSGEVREKLHRRVKGDPREFDVGEGQGLADVNGFGYVDGDSREGRDDRNDGNLGSTGKNNGSGNKDDNADAAPAFFATSKSTNLRKKKSTPNAMELLREGDAGENRRRGGQGRRSRKGGEDQKEEDEPTMQRSDAHANLFAPDTDDENEDSISEVLQYSNRTWRFGRRDNDDDSIYGAGAAVAAAAVAGVGGLGGLVGHDEDGLTRSEVDSCSMLGTESVVRSDIDSMVPSEGESLVGQHLIENDEDEDSDHAGMYAEEDFPGSVAIDGGSRLVGAHGDDADDLHHPRRHPADTISTDLGGTPVIVGGQDDSPGPGLAGVAHGSGFYGTPRGTRRRSQRRDGDGDGDGVQEEGWRRRSKDNHDDEEYGGDDQHHYRRYSFRRSSTLQSTNAVASPSPRGGAYSSPAAAAAAATMPSKMASPGAMANAAGRRFESVGRRGIASSGESRLEDPPAESRAGSTSRDRRPTSMVCNSSSGSAGEFPARVGSAVEVLWERIRVLEQRRGSDAGDSEARAAQLEKENTALKEKLKTLENEQEPQRVKAVEVEKETSALTKRLVALQREAVEARAKGSEKTKALEDRVTIMQRKQKLDAARSRELQQENASLNKRLTDFRGKIDEGKTKTLQKENASLKERIKDLQGKVDEDKTATLQKENASLKERLTTFHEEEDVRARTEQELREENASLRNSVAALQSEEQKNHERSEELSQENASLFERLTVSENQLKKLGEVYNLEDENASLHERVVALQNELDIKMKTSADEVAMLNRRISDLRRSHSENMAAAADEFASLNQRVNGSYKESRELAASHSAQLEAKDQEIEKLQHSLAAAVATAAEKPSSDRHEDVREPPARIYEERLREKDAEISRLETRLLLLHHKKINNIKDDDTDIGRNLDNDNNLDHDNDHDNDPSRKNSAHSVGGVTDEDGGCSSWSASTASSSFSHMDPANAGPSVDRLYTVGGECSIGGGGSSGVVGGVSIKKSAAEVARERRSSNREDAHRGCLVLTCGTVGGKGEATNGAASRADKQQSRRGIKVVQRPSISTSGFRNSKEASPTSTSSVAAAAARLAKAQGVDIIASSCTGARGVGDGVEGFGNASYVFAGAQVHQTAAFWDVLSRTLSSAGEGSSGPSSGVASPRGEEAMGAEEEVEREKTAAAGESAEEKLSVRRISAAPYSAESAKEKTPVRENSLSSSAHDRGKVACALESFSDTALVCGWGEHGVGDVKKENSPTPPSASPAPAAANAAPTSAAPAVGSTAPLSASASTPCCSAAAELRDMERNVREREELAAQAIQSAVRAEEVARAAGENALAALDAAEEKMAAAEKITTTALWQAEGDFSAAEEGIRRREESARRAEVAAREMEAKAKEQRDLCMDLMASAQANAARTEKELASARLAVAKARAAHAPHEAQETQAQQVKSSWQRESRSWSGQRFGVEEAVAQRESRSWSGQRPRVEEVAAQRESRSWSGQRPRVEEAAAQQHQVPGEKASAEQPSPVLVPPSPLSRGGVSRQKSVIAAGVGGDRAINIPATRATAAAVAKYVAALNAAAETSGSPVPL